MSEATGSCVWIDLTQCDDPRDVVHQAVACLARGGVIGVATEAVYALAASALQGSALARLRSLGRLDSAQPLTLMIKSCEEAIDWVPGISRVGLRLARRLWPGPLTLTFPSSMTVGLFGRLPTEVRTRIAPAGGLALGSSADPFTRDVLELSPAPLVLGTVGGLGQEPAVTADSLRDLPGVDMVIDSGPTRWGQSCTRVRIGEESWTIESPGAIDAGTLARMSGWIVLFVCTGNTCRSPMAEAICKLMLARRLDCAPEELEARGYVVLSAGISAMSGAVAASHAVDVLKAMGGSLEGHRSRRVTLDMLRQADCIFAMTGDHMDALLDAIPEVRAYTTLLDPQGGDVPDPIGADHETYRRTAELIEQMLARRLREIAP